MIITISGQYGSGGNEIGQAVAEKLGYQLLDSQLTIRTREIFTETTGGTCPQYWPSRYNEPFMGENDTPLPGTAYDQAQAKLQTDLIGATDQFAELGTAADSVRSAMLASQSQAIMEYIAGGDCVILGKCSNFILRGREDAIHVFIRADLDRRVNRIMSLYNLTMDKVKGSVWRPSSYVIRQGGEFVNMSPATTTELVKKTDRHRGAYYEFITGEKWGMEDKFDFVFDGSDTDLTPLVNKIIARVTG